MALMDHKITGFAKPVSALADVPQMKAAELKAWFDSNSTNEVKNAVNGIIDALVAADGAAQIGTTGGNVQVELDRRVAFQGSEVKYIRLSADKVLEVSADGVSWQTTAAGGHAVADSGGNVLPQRGRVRFENAEVTDRNGETVVRAARSGENLLDNWYFADPINQRGQTSYGHKPAYCIDRWMICEDYAYIDVNSGFLTIRGNDINGYGGILQKLEDSVKTALVGKTITLSVLMKPYTAMKIAGRQVCGGADGAFGIYSATFTGTTGNYVLINAAAPASPGEPIADIIAVKLEIGSEQTLAHQDADGSWILNDMPQNKALELANCQRYYRIGRVRMTYSTEAANIGHIYTPSFMLQPPMRKAPSVTYSNIRTYTYDDVRTLKKMFTARPDMLPGIAINESVTDAVLQMDYTATADL